MKRMKSKNGTAEATLIPSESERKALRKSVASSSARSNLGNGTTKVKSHENGHKRKSCPSIGSAPSGGSVAAAFLTPERVASIFEQDGNMTDAERSREIRRIIMCFTRFLRAPAKEHCISNQTFGSILQVLQTNVDSISDDNWNVVMQALQYAMTPSNCGSSFKNVQLLINEILVHKPNYSSSILGTLISKLVRVTGPNTSSFTDDGPSVSELKCFDVACKLICRIIEVVGMKSLNRTVINMMTSYYPYVLKPSLTHFYYIRNLLAINKVVGSSMTYCVLSVIFHKLTQLDALLPREVLESEELQEIVLPKQEKSSTNPTDSFIISDDESEELVAEVIKSYGKVASHVEQAEQIATMDVSLSYLISFLHSLHENLNFPSLMSIFETEILPTFNTNCVQFAFFYLINLKEEYMNAFLDALWKKFLNVSTPMVLRIQAVGYMAGVLARSTKADRRTLKRWISRLSTFAQEYLSSRSSSSSAHWSNVNIHAHGPFYAACQAIFYTFAFRHFEIVYGNVPHLKDEERLGKKPNIHNLPPPSSTSYIYSLNLQRLITSDLNPLKACTPSVAKTFVEIAHAYQISYCRTVLERNNRATIRNMIYENMRDVSNNSEAGGVNLLNDSFFPFDPLPLAYGKHLVDENFRVYDHNSIALTLLEDSVSPTSYKGRRRGESESQDILNDLELDDEGSNDVIDGQDILLVCE